MFTNMLLQRFSVTGMITTIRCVVDQGPRVLRLLILSGFVLVVSQPTWAQYREGFKWIRKTDYNEKSNPNTDKNGNPVWRYESVVASRQLGNDHRWSETEGKRMWFLDMLNLGEGGWVSSWKDESAIDSYGLDFDFGKAGASIPLVRWINPVDQPFQMRISGTLKVAWRHRKAVTLVDTRVVLVHIQASTKLATVLQSENCSQTGQTGKKEFRVNLEEIDIEPGDQLVISATTPRLQREVPERIFTVGDDLEFVLDRFAAGGTPPKK